MCPLGGHLMDGVTPGYGPSTLVCHCLLVETEAGLVLIDTGLGLEDVRHPEARLATFFRNVCRPERKEEHTAIRQIEALGFKASDVKHIVITHLDFDHAGGISDFPEAQVHLLHAEYEAAHHPHGFINKRRFRPEQWLNSEKWLRYQTGGESWFGFQCVRSLKGLPPEILLVPLVGHTYGHSGVAVKAPDSWLLLAGDAYFYYQEKDPNQPYCPPGARAYQKMMEVDRRSRLQNQARIRELVRMNGNDVIVFCSHDRTEFDALKNIVHTPAEETRLDGWEVTSDFRIIAG